jgi:hypothetical protein
MERAERARVAGRRTCGRGRRSASWPSCSAARSWRGPRCATRSPGSSSGRSLAAGRGFSCNRAGWWLTIGYQTLGPYTDPMFDSKLLLRWVFLKMFVDP